MGRNLIVAQHQLPFSFNVVAKLDKKPARPLPTAGGKRSRHQVEQSEGISPELDQRNVRPRCEGPSQGAPANERTDGATPTINPRDPPLRDQYREGSPSSSLPLTLPPHLPQNVGPSFDSLNTPHQAIVPSRTDPEPTPKLIDVNPESGSITGGGRIWLQGKDFPTLFTLYARFGTAVVSTVSTIETPFEPCLIRILRLSPPIPFLLVICLPWPCQVSSMLHSRRISRQMRRNMGPVLQDFSTSETRIKCKFLACTLGPTLI